MNSESSTREVKTRISGVTTTEIDGEVYEHTQFGWRKMRKARKWVSWLARVGHILSVPCIYVYRRLRNSFAHPPTPEA